MELDEGAVKWKCLKRGRQLHGHARPTPSRARRTASLVLPALQCKERRATRRG